MDDVYILPVLDQFLVYAPLHGLAALVDARAAAHLRQAPESPGGTGPLADLIRQLRSGAAPAPRAPSGPIQPAFLGLIPTRACNLACAYCGFLAPDVPQQTMPLELARDAVAWYLGWVHAAGLPVAEIHFFGGEPLCAPAVVDLVTHLARARAAELGCVVRFEVSTNGAFGEERCRWVADNLDRVVLSLDGPAAVHDRHRPRKDGGSSFEAVSRCARILSEGAAELALRVCVTADSASDPGLPAIADWISREFRPVAVSFEPLQATDRSLAAGLAPPDAWSFARGFLEAASILEAHGIAAVYAAADIRARRATFCPVGQDVPILSPDGRVSACYLLEREWEAAGMDLHLGWMRDGAPVLDAAAVEAARACSVWSKPLCTGCFCRWHCAGGCHVNHRLEAGAAGYDRLCTQTRAIALCSILKALDRHDLAGRLVGDALALERAVWQPTDRLDGAGPAR